MPSYCIVSNGKDLRTCRRDMYWAEFESSDDVHVLHSNNTMDVGFIDLCPQIEPIGYWVGLWRRDIWNMLDDVLCPDYNEGMILTIVKQQ